MKRSIIAAAAAVLMAGAASAADLPRGPAPYYSPSSAAGYNWAGAYAGLNLGYEWGKVSNSAGNPSGIMGGGQVGYNWQNGQFVFGGETDLQISSADDTFAPWKFSNPWFGTLRGRIGYAMNNILVYGTGGLAYADLKGELSGLTETKTELGWTLGLGRVSLYGSRQPRLFGHRHRQWAECQRAAPRRELSLLKFTAVSKY
jgi:outer membrane immunogenic protein